jgi:hypothetical protein
MARTTRGPPAQHRIMDPLCDVEPFQRTPAPLPARKVRLRLSPHFPGFQRPYGLGQKVFCPLGSRSRVRGSWVKSTRSVMQTSGALAPAPAGRPHAESRSSRGGRVPASVRHTTTSARPASRLLWGSPRYRPCSPLPRFMPPRGRHQARHSPHTPKLSCRVSEHASRQPQALENHAPKRYHARHHERPATRP